MTIDMFCTFIATTLFVAYTLSYLDERDPFYLFCAVGFGIATILGNVLIYLK